MKRILVTTAVLGVGLATSCLLIDRVIAVTFHNQTCVLSISLTCAGMGNALCNDMQQKNQGVCVSASCNYCDSGNSTPLTFCAGYEGYDCTTILGAWDCNPSNWMRGRCALIGGCQCGHVVAGVACDSTNISYECRLSRPSFTTLFASR